MQVILTLGPEDLLGASWSPRVGFRIYSLGFAGVCVSPQIHFLFGLVLIFWL